MYVLYEFIWGFWQVWSSIQWGRCESPRGLLMRLLDRLRVDQEDLTADIIFRL